MYIAHPFLAQPPDDAPLWRYMTPTACLSMLLSRSMFFATLDRFEDPFEGVPPPAVIEAARRQRHPESEDARRRLDAWKEMIDRCRATICASCWHVGAEESEAMWKLYGRFEDGLAIVATLGTIKSTFRDHPVTGGLIDYSGREFEAGTAEQNLLQWATTKRPSYKHENEFRLLVKRERNGNEDGNGNDGAGVAVPIDPATLIREVVLSPRMQSWQAELFRELLERLEFTRPVRESSLLTSPF